MKQDRNKLVAVAGGVVALAAATVYFSVKKFKKKKPHELRFLTETAESNKSPDKIIASEEDNNDENVFSVEKVSDSSVETEKNQDETKGDTVSKRAKSIKDILQSEELEVNEDDMFI